VLFISEDIVISGKRVDNSGVTDHKGAGADPAMVEYLTGAGE